MALKTALQDFRASTPGIEAAAYFDIGSNTVLVASSVIDVPQEQLDALCRLSSRLLDATEGPRDRAALMRTTETIMTWRSVNQSDEALCIVCGPDVAIDEASGHAQNFFDAAGAHEK